MCGIVGYIGEKNCKDILIGGLKKLEYRGYDSAGIAVLDNGNIRVTKSEGRLANLEEKILKEGDLTGNCGIGHTRWATHGEPSDVNSHPHGDELLTIVHNGIIENYLNLKEQLIAKGYIFSSETDTEVAAKLFHYNYTGRCKRDPFATIKRVAHQIRGSYALGIIFRDNPETIYAIRKDSPLIIGVGTGENFIASDIPAILEYTRNYYLLDEDEIAILSRDGVRIYDLDGDEVQKELLIAEWDMESAEKGGYPHFMLKEIHEQPEAIRKTISGKIQNGVVNIDESILSEDIIQKTRRIHIVACGTAMHAGMVGKALFESVARVPVDVEIASEFRYKNPILDKSDLVIIISQSGETADTLAALRLAKQKNIRTLAVVNVVGSSIAREADSVIYTLAGPEISVASTKAYSVQLTVMYMLALKFAAVKKSIDEEIIKNISNELLTVPEKIRGLLENADSYKYYASKFQNARDIFFMGRGLDFSLSLEGSLKLKEISYIHSEAYAAGELKHGTISLITNDVPVIALATQKALYEKTVSNIKAVAARGAKVLLICSEGEDTFGISENVITIPDISDLLKPLLAVVPLQLFAYYTAALRGCDIDKPRNLAKSVTVE